MDDNKDNSSVQAQTILLSVGITTLVIIGILFTARDYIASYFYQSIEPRIETLLPEIPKYVSDESRIMSAINTADPAVVSIVVTKNVPVYEQYYETYNPWGLFGGFQVPRIRENGTEEKEVGGGTGFIVTSDGLIVTNRHVVADEDAKYSIVLTNGTVYGVEVLAKDEQLDVAILKITDPLSESLATLSFADSTNLELGQTVIAIGNALAEFRNSVSVGVISGLSRSIVASDGFGASEVLNQVIQTDAAINPGNSGGPLLNIDGKVIGVNVAVSEGADNIGFALPSSLVNQVVESVKNHGEIIRPYLGVRYVMLSKDNAADYGMTNTLGALLYSENDLPAIESMSAAEKAGLRAGDIIIEIDGVSLENIDLATLLRTKAVGEEISITIIRDGVQETVSATLEKAI